MTIQSSGEVTMSNINTELDFSTNSNITLNRADVRELLEVPSGYIKLSNAYGKSNKFQYVKIFTANEANFNLYNALIAAGWNGTQKVKATITVNSGVTVYSTVTTTPAFVVGAIPSGSDITLTVNGSIIGAGGNGGTGGGASGSGPGYVGGSGGHAIDASLVAMKIINNGIIAGGGGGGAGGNATYNSTYSGGGGGGGRGYNPGIAGGRGTGQSANGVPGQPGTLLWGGDGGGGVGSVGGTGVGDGAGYNGGSGSGSGGGGGGAGYGYSGGSGGTSSWYTTAPAGGAGGACAIRAQYVSWLTIGTYYGGIYDSTYGLGAPFIKNIQITADTQDFNLYDALIAAGWNGSKVVSTVVTINSGITVGASSTSTPAFSLGVIPTGSNVLIVNNGSIIGAGGKGGDGGNTVDHAGTVGGDGGPAIESASIAITIENNGLIAGGGGGGAGGYSTYTANNGGGGGGGGRGSTPGAGGTGGYIDGTTTHDGANGAAGTTANSGAGGDGGLVGANGLGGASVISGPGNTGGDGYSSGGGYGGGGGGGSGGGYGCKGGDGGLDKGYYTTRIAGGAAGPAVISSNNVTWSVTGTILGPLS